MHTAIVLIPYADTQRWMMICAQYCAIRHYEIVAVVHAWVDAWQMIVDGRATVLVTGQRDHLPAGREPRLEVVTEHQNEPTSTPLNRRRPVRRTRDRRPANKP